nr:hypothetical protein [uncultured Caproiciproducens sp.]
MRRILAALVGIYLGILLYAGIKLLMNRRDGISAGVIGGADGSTGILVYNSFNVEFFIAQVAVVLLVAVVYYLVHKNRNQR